MIAPYWSAITVRKVAGDISGIKKAEKKDATSMEDGYNWLYFPYNCF